MVVGFFVEQSADKITPSWFLYDDVERSICFHKLRHIRPGTTIYSDEWRAYRGIVRLTGWLLHRRVHHNRHFVDPITRYHTQNIERKWGEFKSDVRQKKGIHDNQLRSHIIEFLWRERFGKLRVHFIIFETMFLNFIRVIKLLYLLVLIFCSLLLLLK
jgi:hypothetical protein